MMMRRTPLIFVLSCAMLGCDRGEKIPGPATLPALERQDLVTISPAATAEIRVMARDQQIDMASEGFVHVHVTDATPGRFRYSMEITTAVDPAKEVFSLCDHMRILVDRDQIPLLQGADIDFAVSERSNGFHFSNPNARPAATNP